MPLFGPNVEKLKAKRDVAGLVKALTHKKWNVRRDVAAALGAIGDPRGVEPLIPALEDKYFPVDKAAPEALGAIGDPRAAEPLTHALGGPASREAVAALGKIGAPAVEPLIAALQDKSYGVRREAPGLLAAIGDPRAIEPLVAALKDEWYVSQAAAEALGKMGDSRGVESLMAALNNETDCVRQGAAEALGRIGTLSVESLVAALKNKDHHVRQAAARLLGSTGNPLAVAPLIAALEDDWYVTRGDVAVAPVAEAAEESLVQLGALAVEPLIPQLMRDEGAKDWRIRLRTARTLGRIGDARAVEPLVALLDDPHRSARWAAITALGRIGEPSRERLVLASQQENALARIGAWEALAALGEPGAVGALIAGLQDGPDRIQAARALGDYGGPQAVDALIEGLSSQASEWSDGALRAEVMQALIKIGLPAVPRVGELLFSKDPPTRSSAGQALSDAVHFGDLKGKPGAWQFVGAVINRGYGRGEVMSLLLLLKELGDPRAGGILAAVDRNDMSTLQRLIRGL